MKSGAFRVPNMYNHLLLVASYFLFRIGRYSGLPHTQLKVEHSLCEHNCPLSFPEVLEALENLPAW
jgi:hypothetical protein